MMRSFSPIWEMGCLLLDMRVWNFPRYASNTRSYGARRTSLYPVWELNTHYPVASPIKVYMYIHMYMLYMHMYMLYMYMCIYIVCIHTDKLRTRL